jgi:hypothetical protein
MKALRTFLRLATAILAIAICSRAADKTTWKPVPDAIVRIDDQGPKQWNLYHTGKNADPLLLQLGGRMLVIYVHDEAVYELSAAQIEHKGSDLLWRETDKPDKPLPTSAWSTRDVGSAWRIRMELTAEGRMFDIQIPQTPDFRRGIY